MQGMNPRQMKKMMQRMGIQQQDIDADLVIIKSGNKETIISNPNVIKVNMMGQETYQITGNISERAVSTEIEISEEDVKTVMEQAGVDEEKARAALESSDGDLAKAIIELSN